MIFLIALVFLSKISWGFLPFMPEQFSVLIFQKGLHPFANAFLNIVVGFVLWFNFVQKKSHTNTQHKFFKIFLVAFMAVLIFVSTGQILANPQEEQLFWQLSLPLMSLFLIFIYARLIPSELPLSQFTSLVKKITVFLCYCSLALFFILPELTFKGGRFIGVFKHIPYMVTTATLACFFLILDFHQQSSSWFKKLNALIALLVSLSCLVLTGTRSALFAVFLGYFLAFIFIPAKKNTTQLLKVSFSVVFILAALLFGQKILDYTLEVARGEAALGLRAAQDGIASRYEEFERGYELFQHSPVLGQGLLSKFGEINEESAGQYNANKDPHNLVVSSGVVGGYPLVVMVLTGFVGLLVLAFKKIKHEDNAVKVVVIYFLTHVPILFIYHIHLSLGGMADRIYWLIFGYLGVQVFAHVRLQKDS